MSFPRGVWGIGKGIGRVSVSAPLPTLGFYLLSRLLLVARGIGHTRLPMKEHLGQPKIVTVLRGRPGNYCYIKAIVRALL